jgi:ribose/xylose/arabinose/galactoside ABC-type transport system permease subunit
LKTKTAELNNSQMSEFNNTRKFDFRKVKNKYMMEFILVGLVIILALFANGFATAPNLLGILRNVAITGVIAFGMTMTIIGGEIDLSVGSSIALSAVLTATLTGKIAEANILPMDYAVIVAMVAALILGGLIGLFNGFIRTRFNLPSFIITLAMLNVLYGLSAIISKGFPVTTLPIWYNYIGAGTIGPIPVPAIWLIIVFVIILIVMNYTRFGREVYAVGGNPEAARLSGINVKKVRKTILVVVQIMAAFSGIILSAQVMSGSSTFGKGYEMDVISSVIIGGASLNGGIGKVWGTFIGIIFLGIIMNGMTLLGVDDYVKYVVRGSLILVAVLLNTIQLQSMSKSTK